MHKMGTCEWERFRSCSQWVQLAQHALLYAQLVSDYNEQNIHKIFLVNLLFFTNYKK